MIPLENLTQKKVQLEIINAQFVSGNGLTNLLITTVKVDPTLKVWEIEELVNPRVKGKLLVMTKEGDLITTIM